MLYYFNLIYLLGHFCNLSSFLSGDISISDKIHEIGECSNLAPFSECENDILNGDYVLELFVDSARTWHSDPRNMTRFNELYKRLTWRLSTQWETIDQSSNKFKFSIHNGTKFRLWHNKFTIETEYYRSRGSLGFTSPSVNCSYSSKYYSFNISKISNSLFGGYTIKSLVKKKYYLDADYFNTDKDNCKVQFWERKSNLIPRDNQEWCIKRLRYGRSLMVNTFSKEYPIVSIRCLKDKHFLGACPMPEREGVMLTKLEGKDGASIDFNPIFTEWLLIPVSDLK